MPFKYFPLSWQCLLVYFLLTSTVSAQSEYRLCANEDCTERISLAKSIIRNYLNAQQGGASFTSADMIYIYSKPIPEDIIGPVIYEVKAYDKSGKLKSEGTASNAVIKEVRKYIKTADLIKVKRSLKRQAKDAKAKDVPVDSGAEVPLHPINPSNVINASPLSGSTESHEIKITSPMSSDSLNIHVPGGVLAELGNGGPPSTPFDVVDGTTFYQGVDGEVTIRPTSTEPPSLNTEVPENAAVVQTMDDLSVPHINNANNEVSDGGDKEGETGNDEEDGSNDDDDDDDGDDNDDEDENEDDEEEEKETQSDEGAKTPGVETENDEVNNPTLSGDENNLTRQKRSAPVESLVEAAKQIDLASNMEPGKSPEFDEQLLETKRLSLLNNESLVGKPLPSQDVSTPVEEPPSRQLPSLSETIATSSSRGGGVGVGDGAAPQNSRASGSELLPKLVPKVTSPENSHVPADVPDQPPVSAPLPESGGSGSTVLLDVSESASSDAPPQKSQTPGGEGAAVPEGHAPKVGSSPQSRYGAGGANDVVLEPRDAPSQKSKTVDGEGEAVPKEKPERHQAEVDASPPSGGAAGVANDVVLDPRDAPPQKSQTVDGEGEAVPKDEPEGYPAEADAPLPSSVAAGAANDVVLEPKDAPPQKSQTVDGVVVDLPKHEPEGSLPENSNGPEGDAPNQPPAGDSPPNSGDAGSGGEVVVEVAPVTQNSQTSGGVGEATSDQLPSSSFEGSNGTFGSSPDDNHNFDSTEGDPASMPVGGSTNDSSEVRKEELFGTQADADTISKIKPRTDTKTDETSGEVLTPNQSAELESELPKNPDQPVNLVTNSSEDLKTEVQTQSQIPVNDVLLSENERNYTATDDELGAANEVPYHQESEHSSIYDKLNSESVAPTTESLPPVRPIYPGLFPPVNNPEPISEERNPREGVGSVEEVIPLHVESTPAPQTNPPGIQNEESIDGESSGTFGFFSSLLSFSSADVPPPVPGKPPAVDGSLEGECKNVKGLESDCVDAPSPAHLWHVFEKTVPQTSYTLLYLIVTSVTLLIFTLGYYFIENSRRNAPFVAKINELTHDLQVATSQLNSRPVLEKSDNTEILTSIQTELAQVKKRNQELQLQVDALQNELDSSADAGMELNKMVTDLLEEKQSANCLLQSVEHLQGQLDAQQRVIDEMTRSLVEKIEENKTLQGELASVQEKSESLEEELTAVRESLNQHLADKESSSWDLENKLDEINRKHKKLLADFAALTDAKAAEIEVLSRSISDLKEQLSLRESEYIALQETVQDLKGGGADAAAVYDIGRVKAQLSRVLSEKENLQETLRDEEGARRFLEDHVKSVDEEVSRLRSAFAAAEKDKVDAETKLVVLSNYWKEKETHFQKELGLQEVMWAQKQGDEITAFDRIKSLQDEVESYNFDSFQNSNEGISMTNSLSSNFTEPVSSCPSTLPSLNSKQNETLSSPEPAPCVSSSPSIPIPKPRQVLRRRLSANFEARLERAELMMKPQSISMVDVPEDLLKLQELQTVRASPFRDTTFSPERMRTSVRSLSDVPKTPKFFDLVRQFDCQRNSTGNIVAMLSQGEVTLTPAIRQNQSKNGLLDGADLCCREPFPGTKCPIEPFPLDDKAGKQVDYDVSPSPLLLDMPLIPVPVPATAPKSPLVDHSESEESQSASKECELTSSATVEFDIKVVANASSSVRKFKMKTSGQNNGSQTAMLKKEIVDQERGLKSQIATLEKKAHENWVAARQAERRLDESKQEAGQLRNMLTLIEKSTVTDGNAASPRLPGELNGDDTALPPLLPDGTSLPPLPGHPPMLPPNFLPPFMPPPLIPPPHLLPGDRRLPPLGRMSSPPLNRFSPGPGDYGYDRMSPTVLSPPTRSYRSPPTHRSSPWDEPSSGFRPVASRRDRRDYPGSNASSGHSSEESLEKHQPTRRGKV